jgi:NTP pyrophosphatase (non-canonical NTP hydrolase)
MTEMTMGYYGDYDYQQAVAGLESMPEALKSIPDKKTARLLHGVLGCGTEAGELQDALKKHIYYGKPLDEGNLVEELGDLLWYVALLCNVLGVSLGEVKQKNIEKLLKRYPGGKFETKHAIERNLENEQETFQMKPADIYDFCEGAD